MAHVEFLTVIKFNEITIQCSKRTTKLYSRLPVDVGSMQCNEQFAYSILLLQSKNTDDKSDGRFYFHFHQSNIESVFLVCVCFFYIASPKPVKHAFSLDPRKTQIYFEWQQQQKKECDT